MNFGFSKSQISKMAAVFSDFPKIEEVIIFGSRAMGNFKTGSDVDLALKGRIKESVVNRVSQRLNGESTLPYKFDVTSYDGISNLDLKKHIDDFGKTLWAL